MSSTGIGSLLQSLDQQQSEWSFVVSDQWVITMQSLSVVSLLASLGVLAFMAHIFIGHRKYLERLSLRISGYVALADILNSITQILALHNDLMIKQTSSSLRFILWCGVLLGLGHIGLLADALGVAWRRRAHASVTETAVAHPAHPIVEAPDAPALEQAAEALRAILHKIAAGIAPTDGSAALAVLTHAIERGGA